jgi:hypothetical protein
MTAQVAYNDSVVFQLDEKKYMKRGKAVTGKKLRRLLAKRARRKSKREKDRAAKK